MLFILFKLFLGYLTIFYNIFILMKWHLRNYNKYIVTVFSGY